MRFTDIFKLSIRMFKARTSRTLLTVLGMSIGIGAILFLVSLGYGLQKTLLEEITTSESLLTLDVTENKSSEAVLDKKMLVEIEEMSGVAETSPSFQLNARGSFENISVDMAVIGVKSSFLRLGGIEVIEGDLIDDREKNGIVISSALSDIFGKDIDKLIGKEMAFTFHKPKPLSKEGEQKSKKSSLNNFTEIKSDTKYKIIGIIEKDSSIAYINAASLEHLEINNYNQVKVKCASNDKMEIVREKLLGKELQVSSLSEAVDQANKVFKVVQIILMLFGIVALVVSAIGMFNTMTIALLERTEEIGIMKSIGASNLAISLMFVMESTIMGFLGGLVGVVIGFAGGELFNIGVNMIASRFGGESIDLFYIPGWFTLSIIAFAGVVGFFTGVIPARRASGIDPLDALRYK